RTSSSRPQRGPAIDLEKFMEKRIRVHFVGGRQVKGTLKGYDQLFNLVLGDAAETDDDDVVEETGRKFGITVCRGITVAMIAPEDEHVSITNPFV
ncbi:LSM-domain-containing protein, partial [Ramicandelaber brevisporus]